MRRYYIKILFNILALFVYGNLGAIYLQNWLTPLPDKKVQGKTARIYLGCALIFLILAFVSLIAAHFSTVLIWWTKEQKKSVMEMNKLLAMEEWKPHKNRIRIRSLWARLIEAARVSLHHSAFQKTTKKEKRATNEANI